MKRDEHRELLDHHLRRLGEQIKTEGRAPQRDLWPGIEARIEANESRPRGTRGRESRPGVTWRVAAVAAVLLLVVGVGGVGRQWMVAPADEKGPAVASLTHATATAEPEGAISILRRLDGTLRELNEALAADPDNSRLSKLVILVHRSRNEILRGRSGTWGLEDL